MLIRRKFIWPGLLLCCLLGSLVSIAAIAQTMQPTVSVPIDSDFTGTDLGKGLHFFAVEPAQDSTDELLHYLSTGVTQGLSPPLLQQLSQYPWLISEQDSLSFGFSPAPRWIRFAIRNDTPTTRDLLLEISNAYLDYVDVYQVTGEGKVIQLSATGDKYPARERLIRHAHFLIPIVLAPAEQSHVLLRVQTSSTNRIPITLWDNQHYISADYFRTLFQSVLYGVFIAISAYYLLLFLYIREQAYIYWSVSILGVLFIVLSLNGTATALIWPDNIVLSDYFIMLGICGTCGASALFSKAVLNLAERPALRMAMNAILVSSLVLWLGTFFIAYQLALKLGLVLALFNAAAQMIVNVSRLFDGYQPARYVVFAITLVCLGVVINILTVSGRLPSSVLGTNALGISATLAVLLYSLALSNRMNLDRAAREKAQLKLASDLDHKVRERTQALKQAHQQLLVASTTDGLTGLLNRRHFDEVFDSEYRSAFRQKQPIAVLMMDVDHFKQLNDTYGHPFGDLCLKFIAQQFSGCLNRPPDISARYGGEEFIVVLPNTPLQGAVTVAQAIRSKIAQTPVKDPNHCVNLTVSIGVASVVPVAIGQQAELIQCADNYLYQAKRLGRNRVAYE
jgi:diguanylate cyclase